MTSPQLSAEEQNRHDISRFRISIGQLGHSYSENDPIRDLLATEVTIDALTWKSIRDLLEENPHNAQHIASAINRRLKQDEHELRVWLARMMNCYSTLAGDQKIKVHRHEHVLSVIEGLGKYKTEFTLEQERKLAYGTLRYDNNKMQDIIVDDYSAQDAIVDDFDQFNIRATYTMVREPEMVDAIKDADWKRLHAVADRIMNGEIKRDPHLLAALNAKGSIALAEGAL
jgi:hypothetical protein